MTKRLLSLERHPTGSPNPDLYLHRGTHVATAHREPHATVADSMIYLTKTLLSSRFFTRWTCVLFLSSIDISMARRVDQWRSHMQGINRSRAVIKSRTGTAPPTTSEVGKSHCLRVSSPVGLAYCSLALSISPWRGASTSGGLICRALTVHEL